MAEAIFIADGPLAFRRQAIEPGLNEVVLGEEATVYVRTDRFEMDEAVFETRI